MFDLSLPTDETTRILVIVGIGFFLISWIFLFVWTIRDVMHRTRNILFQTLAGAFVALFHIVGVLIYLLFRPRRTLEEQYYEELEHQALAASLDEEICTKCYCKVSNEFAYCPQCSHQLKVPCNKCNKLVRPSWKICPHCGTTQKPAGKSAKKRPASRKSK